MHHGVKTIEAMSASATNNVLTQGEEIVQGTFRTSSFGREYVPGEEQIYEDELYSCSLVDAPEYDNHPRMSPLRDKFPTKA